MVRKNHQILKFVCIINFLELVDCFGTCLKPPTFVSSWRDIAAQDASLSEVVINHGLGELPVKVDVQVKPVDKTGKVDTFMFNGIGSAQRDDDVNDTYGGVVYIYNETTVTLITPNRQNGFYSGYAVYTGDDVWSGPSVQKSKKAKVRVRVWKKEDFPSPDFESQWIKVASGQRDGSYFEIAHNLNTEPRYVSLQLRSDTTNYTSDGVGSGTGYDHPKSDASWGGVLYGYNKNKVRIWLPNRISGTLFAASDGWGKSNRSWSSGYVRVRVWKEPSDQIVHFHINVKSNATNETLQTAIPNNNTIQIDEDIFLMEVVPNAGPNNGFLFKSTGATENANRNQTYGSFMYSYSDAEFRMYHPPFPVLHRANGSLLDISDIWGNGTNNQQTNDVRLRVEIIRPASVCPTTTTTKTTIKSVPGTATSTSSNSLVKEESSDGGLSPAAAAGIGVGVAALLLGSLACLIWGLIKRRNKKKRSVKDMKENEENVNKETTEQSQDQKNEDVSDDKDNTEDLEQPQQNDDMAQTNEM